MKPNFSANLRKAEPLPRITGVEKHLARFNAAPRDFKGRFFGAPIEVLLQYDLDNKVSAQLYSAGNLVTTIKDKPAEHNEKAILDLIKKHFADYFSYSKQVGRDVKKFVKAVADGVKLENTPKNKRPKAAAKRQTATRTDQTKKKTPAPQMTGKVINTGSLSNYPTKSARKTRLSNYWRERGFLAIYKEMRTPQIEPPNSWKIIDLDNLPVAYEKVYKCSGVVFGRWLNEQDRYNYALIGLQALHDLNVALNFKENMGFSILTVAYGAAGVKNSLGSYAPNIYQININRFKRPDKVGLRGENVRLDDKKYTAFFSAENNAECFAHEYGHFLDNVFANLNNYGGSAYFLSSATTDNVLATSVNKAVDVLAKDPKWRKLVQEEHPKKFNYFVDRAEIWARLFEQYIAEKLSERFITNRALTKTKSFYSKFVYYAKPAQFRKAAPHIYRAIKEIQKIIEK